VQPWPPGRLTDATPRPFRSAAQRANFDPDRFLPGAPHGPADRTSYVPFGWAPKKCVGANIGTFQLMALCHLLCTRYRLTARRPHEITMALRFAPVPENFRGRLTRR
jgi:cytochrome P450